jgi:hypothetical protein
MPVTLFQTGQISHFDDLATLSREELIVLAGELMNANHIQRNALAEYVAEQERLSIELDKYRRQEQNAIPLLLKPEWSGLEKVVHALKQAGRPMQLVELVTLISRFDPGLLAAKYPQKAISTILSRGIKAGVFTAELKPGVRGRFYALFHTVAKM